MTNTISMLDLKSNLILKILKKECKNGGYKIIDKSDVISSLPGKYRCEFEELDHITSYLERQDYISIKYDDENVYCLCILPRANEENETKKIKKSKLPIIIPILSLLMGFIGALIGSIIQKFI